MLRGVGACVCSCVLVCVRVQRSDERQARLRRAEHPARLVSAPLHYISNDVGIGLACGLQQPRDLRGVVVLRVQRGGRVVARRGRGVAPRGMQRLPPPPVRGAWRAVASTRRRAPAHLAALAAVDAERGAAAQEAHQREQDEQQRSRRTAVAAHRHAGHPAQRAARARRRRVLSASARRSRAVEGRSGRGASAAAAAPLRGPRRRPRCAPPAPPRHPSVPASARCARPPTTGPLALRGARAAAHLFPIAWRAYRSRVGRVGARANVSGQVCAPGSGRGTEGRCAGRRGKLRRICAPPGAAAAACGRSRACPAPPRPAATVLYMLWHSFVTPPAHATRHGARLACCEPRAKQRPADYCSAADAARASWSLAAAPLDAPHAPAA